MATRSKLTLINGEIDQAGSILMYQTVNSFESVCPSGDFGVPPLPFPDDDDDWDDFDQSSDQAK